MPGASAVPGGDRVADDEQDRGLALREYRPRRRDARRRERKRRCDDKPATGDHGDGREDMARL